MIIKLFAVLTKGIGGVSDSLIQKGICEGDCRTSDL